MAYNKVVVLLVLSMLAAASNSMAAAQFGAVPNTPGEWCYYQGMGFPAYPFPRCRALVKSQCLGAQVTQSVREDCCRQLAAIPDEFCKCPALGHMRDSMYKELGVVMKGEGVGHGTVEAADIFPGCRTEVMDRAIASIPAFCNQYIPTGTGGVCYWLSHYQHPKQVTSA